MTIKQRGKALITFANKSASKGELLIYSEIGDSYWGESYSAKQFAADLKALGAITELEIRINSPGGSCFDGFAFYNLLSQHPAEKTVYIDGMAASIASVICMCGSKIVMAEASHMMIHDPYGGCLGTAVEMRKTADLLDSIKGTIAKVYSDRSGQPVDVFDRAMAAETWYTADEALKAGLCTEISKNQALAAHFDPSQFNYKNMPKDLIVEKSEGKSKSLKITLDVDASALQTALDAANKSLEEMAAKLKAFENAAETDDEETPEPKPDEVPEETEDVENSAVPWKLNLAKRKQELAKARGE